MDEIDQVREYDEENLRRTKLYLGDTVSLLQDLVELYKFLADLIAKSSLGSRDEIVCAADFLLACRYQLTLGALSLLRGHLTDSSSFTRKAIEFSAFAVLIKKRPDLGLVWLNAGSNEDSYKKYREKFRTVKLFPKNHALLKVLYLRYDQCSKQNHPSIFSICQHISVFPVGDKINLQFNYFELKQGDASEPVRTLLWLVDTHFVIIRVFEEVLFDVIAKEQIKWEVRRNAVEGKIEIHHGKWKDVTMQP